MSAGLQGRLALVTGGGRGIGRAMAIGLARNGADVIVVYRSDREQAESTAAEIERSNVRGHVARCDIGDPASVADLGEELDRQGLAVDILVNNAGWYRRSPALELSTEDWIAMINGNLTGHFLISQMIAGRMRDDGRKGCIVNVTSVAQGAVSRGMVGYNVSKAGLWALTRQLAFELAPYGIRVNAIAPGLTETDMNRQQLQELSYRAERLSRIPLGFLGEPEDHVGALLYLVSDSAKFITGACIATDGGSSLTGPPAIPIESRGA